MRKYSQLKGALCTLIVLIVVGCENTWLNPRGELYMNECVKETVRNSKEVIRVAQEFLRSLGNPSKGTFVELRVDDPVNKRKYSLVLVGSLNTPVSDVVMVSGEKLEECGHAAFSPPIVYLGAESAIAAAGITPNDVKKCRLLRVLKRPYNNNFSPIWEISSSTNTFFVDQAGHVIESDYNALLKRDLGG